MFIQNNIIKIKKSAEHLKDNQDKYRRWFEDDLTGDFIATTEGILIECNPAFVGIYGFDNQEQAVGSDISKFNSNDWVKLISHLKNEYKLSGHQTWHLRPDNKKIHVVTNVVGIFNDSNELIQVKGYVFDDTERKIAEEDLKKSEEKYHKLFDEDLTGDFIATPNGKILECNPAFAEIYAFDNCKEALKWNISQSNPFDWSHIITRLKKECKISGYQSWQRRGDGLRIHVVANVVGIFNGSNKLIQVKGYIFDDTDRKKAEQEVIHSKNQTKDILDGIQDGFVSLDDYWYFTYVNPKAAEYLEFEEPDDLIKRNIWETFPELSGTQYETAFRRAMENQEVQHFEAPGFFNKKYIYDFSIYPLDGGIIIFWRSKNMIPKINNQKIE